MIEQNAVVRDCQDGVALVEVHRATACGTCAGQSGCGTAPVAELFARRTARVTARNPIGARPGESVVVGYDERAFLHAAMLLYLLPIAALAVASAAATALGGSELWGVLGAAGGLAGGLVLSRRLAGGLGQRSGRDLTILRRAVADSGLPTSLGASRDSCSGE